VKNKSDIKLGISSCLLGKNVRFDSGHKRDRYITDLLGQFVTFVPVCPEVEVGMGVPREAVRLIGDLNNPQMVGTQSEKDWTSKMNDYSRQRVLKKNLAGISGFILKSKSPSCGMERVKVYITPTRAEKKGVGLFAAALIKQFPHLPIEEEGRLNDAALRENFIEQVFAYNRLQCLYAEPFSRNKIIEFHSAHKYLLLSHSPEYYRRMGQLVANIKKTSPPEFKRLYEELFIAALKFRTTVRKNSNVLQHIAGFLKKHITKSEKAEIQEAIDDYHNELTPLIVPLTLLKHFINKYDIEYIRNQYYLNPHPKELMLRNHI